jgi:hypothetical protein
MARELTDVMLRAASKTTSGRGRYDLSDGRIKAFGVRVNGQNPLTFYLYARFPGKRSPTRAVIGTYGPKTDFTARVFTLADARDEAIRWRGVLDRGLDPREEAERERRENLQKRNNTFAAVAEDFIGAELGRQRKGREVEQNIRRELLPKWGPRPIADILPTDVRALVKAKLSTAPTQARNLLSQVKTLFAWAVDEEAYGLKVSPAAALKPRKLIGPRARTDRLLSDDELRALWRASGRLPYPHGPAYRLLLLTALRLNEVADVSATELHPTIARALRNRKASKGVGWSDVPPTDWIWTIPKERMKGRNEDARAHVIPLTPGVLDILEKLPTFGAEDCFLLSTTGGKKPAWISTKVKQRLDALMLKTLRAMARSRGDDWRAVKLPRWTNHDIRRTVRSHLSRLKVTEEAREAVLAHVRPGIKGVYDVHDYLDEKREALMLWETRLRDIVSRIGG